MKNLFIGGSSDIAKKVAKKLTYVESISRKKSVIYNKNYVVKSYTKKNLHKILFRL